MLKNLYSKRHSRILKTACMLSTGNQQFNYHFIIFEFAQKVL